MKPWLFIGGGLALVLVVLALTGKKGVRASRIVSATPEELWAVLMDTSAYGEWNPVFSSAQGELKVGAKPEYQMQNPDGSATAVSSTVMKLEPTKELNQYGGIPGVITFDHHWEFEAVDGGTRVTQCEEYTGIYVWFWNPEFYEQQYDAAIGAIEAQAIKRRGTQ